MRLGWMRIGLVSVLFVSCAESNFALREVEAVPQDVGADQDHPSIQNESKLAGSVEEKNRADKLKNKKSNSHIALRAGDEWTLLSDENGIKTFEEKSPHQDKVAFRGEVIIPAPLLNVITVMHDKELRKHWVDSYLESRLIEQEDQFNRIEYHLTQVPWPFQNRDFVYHVKTRVHFQPLSVELTMGSVDDARVPEREGVVRGEIVLCKYLIQEQKNENGVNTVVIVEMSVDPKGAIPAWIVNLAQKRWPQNTLGAMRKVATRPNLNIPKEIAQIFNQKPKGRI